jgi:hypothetical protein
MAVGEDELKKETLDDIEAATLILKEVLSRLQETHKLRAV